MNFFINLGVKKKLVLVFSLISIFIILIGVQGILSSAKINEGSKAIYSNNLVSIRDLEEIKGNINNIGSNVLMIAFERDRSKLDEQIKAIEEYTKEDDIFIKEYVSLPSTSEEQKTFDDFKNDLIKYRELRNKVIDLAKANNYDVAVKVYNSEMTVIRDSMLDKLDKCIAINEQSAKQANLNNIAQFNSIRNLIMIYTATAFFIIIFIGYILSKNIVEPLNKIRDLAQRLSNYDFSTSITITRKDEFGQTSIALNTSTGKCK
ncbi:four helix bundle sensory module for signal transduction [Clostridium magnum DSM 2767]|uniref:Four helix bundle sensory module for signal transduction n=1 Tax=Clostridium magnum DSM 2767 TaxID=1121326 RepID=A0A161XDC7_9CLOT|nr:MCP four helix bundle domain-containing protein [Clostridium magnum]KZL92346.1 four helix bundle sensory module for signal transduction [Clostridium magnum DSM 2767]SHH12624.1 HAMP domain-containing protein [Clostridium magnum DSM 2767]